MLHQTGQSRARPYTIGIEHDEILLGDKLGIVLDVLKAEDWDLKLSGVDDDQLVLEDLSRGQRLIGDIKFLDALLASNVSVSMVAKARKIKQEIKERSPSDISATALLCVLVIVFLLWLGVGFPVSMNAYKDKLANEPAYIKMPTPEQDLYTRSVAKIIESRWRPDSGDEDRETVLRFDVLRNGRAANIKVVKTSGDPAFDDHAKTTLRGAQFDPLPDILGNSVQLEFTFAFKKP